MVLVVPEVEAKPLENFEIWLYSTPLKIVILHSVLQGFFFFIIFCSFRVIKILLIKIEKD